MVVSHHLFYCANLISFFFFELTHPYPDTFDDCGVSHMFDEGKKAKFISFLLILFFFSLSEIIAQAMVRD